MIKVYISNEVKAPFTYKTLFTKALKALVKLHNIEGDTEANLIITNNEGIREISKEYKKKDKATDVLSFPAGYKDLKNIIGYNMLGDIFISFEKVKFQAENYGHSEEREWVYLFTHGLLHLIGYDHMTEPEEEEMSSEANKIMNEIKVGR